MTCATSRLSLSSSTPDLHLLDNGNANEDEEEELVQLIDDGIDFRWDFTPKKMNALNLPEVLPRPNSAPNVDTPSHDEYSCLDFIGDDVILMSDQMMEANCDKSGILTNENENQTFDQSHGSEIDRNDVQITTYQADRNDEIRTKNITDIDRNILNLTQIQCIQAARNTPFRPVVPAISEDSGEDIAGSQGEVDNIKESQKQDKEQKKEEMFHNRQSSITLTDLSSTDDSSGSSDETQPISPPNYNNRRRHSIATTTADHLAQVLTLLHRPRKTEDGPAVLMTDKLSTPLYTSPRKVSHKKSERNSPLSSSPDTISEHKGKKHEKVNENLAFGQVKGGSNDRSKHTPRRRFSLADVKSFCQTVQDPSFAREIFHHQLVHLASSQDSIDENNGSYNQRYQQKRDSDNCKPPPSYLRTRRCSLGNIGAQNIQPLLNKEKTNESKQRSNPICNNLDAVVKPAETDRFSRDHSDKLDCVPPPEVPSRQRQRRSSWACIGAHPTTQQISAFTLLREGNFSGDQEEVERPEVKDPYRLTVHFITDPKQSKVLKNLLRPITHSVASKLKLFNYVERSEPIVKEANTTNLDPLNIPALAIMVFFHEEHGLERILKAQHYLREKPWKLHHQVQVSGNVVLYPTNNQDFYSHEDGLPLWAVRQVHLGKDRLRFMLFVSCQNWDDSVEFYSKILSREVQFRKDDFCYFLVFSCKKLNLEVQLALKKLPEGITPRPLDDAILQFKVHDMGLLVPLMPCVCSPISDRRWQTTDLDGNKVLLFRQSEINESHSCQKDEREIASPCSSPTDSEQSGVSLIDSQPQFLIYDAFNQSDIAYAV